MITLKCCLQYRDIVSTRIYCLHDRNVIVLFYQPPIEDWLQVVRCSNILGVCVQQSIECWKLMVVALVVLGGYGLLNIPAATGIWTLNKISCEPCTGIGSLLNFHSSLVLVLGIRVQGWILAGMGQVYIYIPSIKIGTALVWSWYYLMSLLARYWYEAAIIPCADFLLSTRPVQGWYCRRSYHFDQFFDTRTTSVHIRRLVPACYPPNTGNEFESKLWLIQRECFSWEGTWDVLLLWFQKAWFVCCDTLS
jgi:hypothetical protein